MTDLSSVRLTKNLILKQSSHDGIARLELDPSQKKRCAGLIVFKIKIQLLPFFPHFTGIFQSALSVSF